MEAQTLARLIEDDEQAHKPMTDSEHHAVFGWGWDDPDGEVGA